MIKLKSLLTEGLDDPYRFSHSFETELVDTEDEESGETYKKDVMQPVQIVKFSTDNGVSYIWYARQNRYDPTLWEIAFGVEQVQDYSDTGHKLNIGITGTGNASRVFATVIAIINSFVEFDEDNYEVIRMLFTSKGDKRTRLYLNHIVPRIENFKVENSRNVGADETEIILIRTN